MSTKLMGVMLLALSLAGCKKEVQIDGELARRAPGLIAEILSTESADGDTVPFNIRVQVSPGAPLPPELQPYLQRDFKPARDRRRARFFTLFSPDRAALESAIKDRSVSYVEIADPEAIEPEQQVLNADARRSHSVDVFEGTYPSFHGENVAAAVFDRGAVLSSHREFRVQDADSSSSRIRVRTPNGIDDHATHVAGTMAAAGRDLRAKGMATGLHVVSEDWTSDINKLETIASGIQLSNHSYGPLAGWSSSTGSWRWYGDLSMSNAEDASFGKYSLKASQLDAVLFRFPHVLTFAAAGNDRNDGPKHQPVEHRVRTAAGWTQCKAEHVPDGEDQGGHDTLIGMCLAKNSLCIGAVHDIDPSSPQKARPTDSSAWGPADDGRIKPDLVANGFGLLSTSAGDDEAYSENTGTSMATPTASGISALLIQQFQALRGRSPVAAEIKGVLIHTAIDAGEPGPDPIFGWGVIHAFRGGRVIERTGQHIIDRRDIRSGETLEYLLEPSDSNQPVRVTVVWTDPAAKPNGGGLDDPARTLQNDLDVELVAPGGGVAYPYSLDRSNPRLRATRTGPNTTDNVEMIDASAKPGEWKLRIRASALKVGPTQRFALLVSGLKRKE